MKQKFLSVAFFAFSFGVAFSQQDFFSVVENAFPGQNPLAVSYGGFWADIDADGDEDLFVTNLGDTVRNYLYLNKGDGSFAKINTGAIVNDFRESRSASWGDINNDGYPDLFVGAVPEFQAGSESVSAVYVNKKDLTFQRVILDTKAIGGIWGDVNNDGYLDLAVYLDGQPVKFYLNDKLGGLSLWSQQIAESTSWYAALLDFDNDRDMDLSQSFSSGTPLFKLYRNEGTGFVSTSLIEIPSFSAGDQGGINHRGGSWADFNDDGYLDFLALNQLGNFGDSYFFFSNKNGTFTRKLFKDITGETLRSARSSAIGDYNNDGYQDIFTIGGLVENSGVIQCYLFRGGPNATFSRVSNASQTFAFTDMFSQLSLADYNNDGFLDLFESSQGSETVNLLFKNKGNGNGWLKVKLVGTESNKLGIGSRISVKANGMWQTRQILSQSGLSSQSSMIAHFGIAGASKVDSVRVFWTSGKNTELKDVEKNKLLTVLEDDPATNLEQKATVDFTVFPNPFDDIIQLNSTGSPVKFDLVDMFGRSILNGTLSGGEEVINTECIPAGIYILEAMNGNTSRQFKVLKHPSH